MKINCKLLIYCSMIITFNLLSGCASVPTKEQIYTANYGGYPSNYQTSIMNSMNTTLFDPYSARYRFGSLYKGYAYVNGSGKPPVFGYLVVVGINAKNRMGGYVGEKPHTFLFKDDSVWNLKSFVTRGRVENATVKEPSTEASTGETPSSKSSLEDSSTQIINGSIMNLSGSGMKNTRPFIVHGPWEIQWDLKGSFIAIAIYTADGTLVGIAANQQGTGKGSSYQPKSGRYYIGINAIGDWRVKVVSIK